MSDGTVFHDTASQMSARLAGIPGNLNKKEDGYNDWLQSQVPFQSTHPAGEYDQDHQIHDDPTNLPPWRILAGAFVGEIVMWVAVHFYDDSPLSFTVRCQDKNIPITGDWWL
jgi:hypothetical protein